MALALAAMDWALHLAASPGRQTTLAMTALSRQSALLQGTRLSARGQTDEQGRAEDRRFRAEGLGPVAILGLRRRLSRSGAMVG